METSFTTCLISILGPQSTHYLTAPLPVYVASMLTNVTIIQYQLLADKYAPAAPHISETLAKLQLPPSPSLISSNHVPLPRRHQSDSSQAELALFIREGKKVAQQLAMLTDASKASGSSRETLSTHMTSQSTVLEKDFTVEGRKGHLGCPFSPMNKDEPNPDEVAVDGASENQDPTPPRQPDDPICAAMAPESTSAPTAPNGSASKCPIRYMDKHSPEEIARYVETHKHELPRSHEVCLRRNQKNEEQIRKLDAKYGNIVSMIEDLSHLHAPMLPSAEPNRGAEADRASNRRVCDWAQDVSASAVDGLADEAVKNGGDGDVPTAEQYLERTSHFDRPLKEVRVGESPSRPWGISVPFPPDELVERPASPVAPVRMPSPEPELERERTPTPKAQAAGPSKCPFDHTKMRLNGPGLSEFPKMEESGGLPQLSPHEPAASQPCTTPLKHTQPLPPDSPPPSHQPAFINTIGASKEGTAGGNPAQMVFNGPVFIGYPIEDAIRFMQQFQGQSR